MRLIDLWPLPLYNELRVIQTPGGEWIAERKRWWLQAWIRTGHATEQQLVAAAKGKPMAFRCPRNAVAKKIEAVLANAF